ncbi:MAG: S-layer homology domain-containing protein [Clostridia bacterium]|nr:S-layer homology domain-containing protein [Clostridia bacterium]
MLNKKLKHAAIFAAFVIGSGALFHVTVKSMQNARTAENVIAAEPAETIPVDPLGAEQPAAEPASDTAAETPAAVTDTLSASSPLSDAAPATPAPSSGGNTVSVIDDDPEPEEPSGEGVGYADGEALVMTARVSLTLKKSGVEHTTFLHGYEDGTFRPSGTITRAEACQILYNLLSEQPTDRAKLSDTASNAWYYDAVAALASYGVIDVTDAKARPTEPMTRGEFVSALAYFFPGKITPADDFPDVKTNHPYYGAIQKAAAKGWIKGYDDGTFRPNGTITRAEAATVVNRALGRTADEAWIALNLGTATPLYTDLPATHWAYATVMEAALAHSAAGSSPETWTSVEGYAADDRLLFDGNDYSIMGADGQLLTDTVWGNHLILDASGTYTCGDADVDAMAKAILASITTPSMSREDKLEAAFVYVRDGYFYRRNNFYEVGQTGWEVEEARTMYETGKGNCYNYTAAFCMLARQLGYDANAISGLVGIEQQQHGWVEIPVDGELLIFDTTLESSYLAEDPSWNLKFFGLSYADIPWPYTK